MTTAGKRSGSQTTFASGGSDSLVLLGRGVAARLARGEPLGPCWRDLCGKVPRLESASGTSPPPAAWRAPAFPERGWFRLVGA